MKKALLIRFGAYGDMVILSPVISRLKKNGYYIILHCGRRGAEVYKHDPRIDELIEGSEEAVPYEDLMKSWKKLKDKIKPDFFANFTQSIEHNIALHPTDPIYVYSKEDRFKECNKNYYEETMKWAEFEIEPGDLPLKPELHYTHDEQREASSYIKTDRLNVLWCLSGSAKNKVYPFTEYVMGDLIRKYPDINFITVGDVKCKLLENVMHHLPEHNFTELAGEVSMRIAMLLTCMVDLVVSPDTGILHASGCWDTPKIGLLGHTTKENITKHFVNDFSIEAQCPCSPCFHLIYDFDIQCPIEDVTHAAWCMAVGIPPEALFERITHTLEQFYDTEEISKRGETKECNPQAVSDLQCAN